LRTVRASVGFSHIFSSVANFERAFVFYSAVLAELGLELRFRDPAKPWAGWHSPGGECPYLVICKPYDGQAHQPGNGQMVAFAASSRVSVQSAYQVAIASGGRSEGEPGPRPEYHANYYGAYFRDSEGNKVCVASHGPI